MAFHLGPRVAVVLKYVGFVLLALVTFVLALQLTFPFDSVKDRMEEAISQKYDVTIKSIERGWVPGRMYLNAVTLRTRPNPVDVQKAMEIADPKEREKALALLTSTLFVDRIEVDLGIMALFRGVASINIDAQIGPGRIKGSVAISEGGSGIHISGDDLPAQMLPMREIVGLPMSGKLDFEVDLDLPNEKLKTGKMGPNWLKADGGIELACPTGCTFGDGKTKLKAKLKNPRNQAFAEQGIDFGKVNIDNLLAKVEIKDGNLDLKKFEAKSQDGELHVDFHLTLAQEFNESMTMGCLRFKGSDGLLKREPKTHAAISTTGAQLGPDGLFHIKLTDKFKDMKRLPQSCGPGITDKAMDDFSGGSPTRRPNLTIPEPADAGVVAIPPPPPTPIVPPVDAGVTFQDSLVLPTPTPGAVDHPPMPATGGAEPAPGSGTAGAAGAGSAPPAPQ